MPADAHSPPTVTWTRWLLSLWLAAAAAGAYLCRNCLVVAEKTIRADLNLTEDQMGLVMGMFFWSYALAQIPGGWLGTRFGSRLSLPLFSAWWSAAMFLWGAATGMAALVVARLSSGLAQAGLFPCSVISISRWFPSTERGTASGMLAASMQVGAIIAAPLTAVLLKWYSWRVVFAVYAIPGIVWAVAFWLWFRETPEQHSSVNEAELQHIQQGRLDDDNATDDQPPSTPWLRLATSPTMWLICSQQFFRAAAYVWFASWFATYLQETRGVTREASGWLTAVPLSASMLAGLTSGGLSDWVLRRTGSLSWARSGVAAVSLFTCSVLVFSAYFIGDATLATVVIGAGAFFAACAGPCAYAATMDVGGRHVAAVFSTMNMIGNFGAGLLAYLVPKYRVWIDANDTLLSLSGGNSWNAVLVLFGVMYVLAAVCWIGLRMDGTLFDDSPTSARTSR